MKEPFVTVADLATQAGLASDTAFQAYTSQLSKAQQKEFASSMIVGAMQTVDDNRLSTFDTQMSNITGADNNVTAATYYLNRTKDLNFLAQDMNSITEDQLNTIDLNNDLQLRQKEINEWSNFNKIDTIYFLQISFIVLTFISILVFLNMNGFISGFIFTLLSILAGLIAVLVLIFSTRYNNVSRDSRYWHKARFIKPVPYTT